MSPCTCFDALWREEHDGARNIPLAVLVHTLFAENVLPKTAILTFLWPLAPKPLILAQTWRHASERTILELSSPLSRPPA